VEKREARLYERLKLLEDEYALLQVYAHNLENLVNENGLQASLPALMETVRARARNYISSQNISYISLDCFIFILRRPNKKWWWLLKQLESRFPEHSRYRLQLTAAVELAQHRVATNKGDRVITIT